MSLSRLIGIMRFLFTLLLSLLCIYAIAQQAISSYTTPSSGNAEMRGIWVASIANIDWPRETRYDVESLKQDIDEIVRHIKSLKLNTILLQVRPASDAIYRSSIEPLTSYMWEHESDTIRFESFDALQYWIETAHRNGLELHAWMNPFRAMPSEEFRYAKRHVINQHPELLISYGGKKILDPGLPEARKYVLSVVSDVLRRYDVDGIHFDDYFYPYPVAGESFDDAASFSKYNPDNLSLSDWRRSNVTAFISDVSKVVHSLKPWVQFGVSPFGVWRNIRDDENGSQSRAGITNYDVLFADVKLWAEQGLVDYLVPQVYWESGYEFADFDVLTKWWSEQASAKTLMFVGHAVFKINTQGPKHWKNDKEMQMQIAKVRDDANLNGSVFFSYRQFLRDLNGLQDDMQNIIYTSFARTPFKSFGSEKWNIGSPIIREQKGVLSWSLEFPVDTTNVRFYCVYRYPKGETPDMLGPEHIYAVTSDSHIQLSVATRRSDRRKYVFRVSAISKMRSESALSKRIVVKM